MPQQPLKILVLEDHDFQRAFTVAELRALGYTEIFEAGDGAQALEVLEKKGAIDIAICDLQMEGMDGIDFLYQIAKSKLVKGVVISSSLRLELRRSVQKIVPLLGFQLLGDIGKPFDSDQLKQLLDKYKYEKYKAAMLSAVELPLETEEEVIRAFNAQEIVHYYQPKFDLQTGEVTGAEVLARWIHAKRGVILPAAFLPTIERCGLMEDFFFKQLKLSLELQKKTIKQGRNINLSLNLYRGILANPDLHARIQSCIGDHKVPYSSVTFELVGSDALDIDPVTHRNLLRLRMLGCKLSADGFGSDHLSLQHLCELPLTEIKIGPDFIADLDTDPRCHDIIRNILALGASLGMSVVVEGIETQEQRQQLLELGCTLGQGYYYARPMCGADFLRWLDNQDRGPA